jgi:acyl-CoA synthetase (AMP-forming)/AMP-acid ligase II
MGHLARWAERQPEKTVLIFPETGETRTTSELDRRSNRAAQWLIGLGLRPDDTIALLCDNRPEFFEIAFATRRAGLHYTPLSIHLRPNEIAYVLQDSGAKAIIVSPALAELASELVAQGAVGGRLRFALGESLPGYDSYEASLARYQPGPLPERPVGRVFLYSSGTTGLPKGIRRALLPPSEHAGQEFDMHWKHWYGFDQNTVYLSPAPLYHAAPNAYCMRTITEGGTVVVLKKFDAERCLQSIEHYRVTHSQWVPTMFVRMLALPDEVRKKYDLSSHRCAIHAAAPCPAEVKRAMIEWWGPIIKEYYAGSESIGTTVIDSETWLRKPGSVGPPVNNVKLHILDEQGAELPPHEVGQIWFEGGPAFAYHNAPEKTAAARNAKGWQTLGDLGSVDEEGFLYLSDRRADLILSGGVNLYPAEIEQVLVQHPAVREVAVVGVPHPDFGEQVKAVVVLRDETAAGPALAAELQDFARRHLAGPKVPRAVEFVQELPRSEAGKLLRRLLKEQHRGG